MAVTVGSAQFDSYLGTTLRNGAGGRHSFALNFEETLQDSSNDYLFDRVFALENYSLTTAAGNLDLDLYDLGTFNVGAGAGRDNAGLDHANARIVAIAIRNREVSGNGTLRVDNSGATNPWTGIWKSDQVYDFAQGAYLTAYLGESGKTVTDASNHIMRVSAQTNDCNIDIAFWSKQS